MPPQLKKSILGRSLVTLKQEAQDRIRHSLAQVKAGTYELTKLWLCGS